MAKRIRIEGISRIGFERRWMRVFALGISKDDVKRCVSGQYIWHVFSYRLLDSSVYLQGEAAMEAFKHVDKEKAYCLQPFMRKKVLPLTDAHCDPAEINMNCGEIYIVPEDFSWTYIKTHEGDLCGPYFMRADKHATTSHESVTK